MNGVPKHQVDRTVAALRPRVHGAEGIDPRLSPGARELAALIVMDPNEQAAPRRARRGRRALWALPVAVGVAASVVAGTFLFLAPEERQEMVYTLAPFSPPVTDIVVEDGVVTARLLRADGARSAYRDEFAEVGLDVRVVFEPVSPGQVGEVVHLDVDAGTETPEEGRGVEVEGSPGECSADAGCPAVIRIPADHPTPVVVSLGRAAEEGEYYTLSQSAGAPGEVLEGVELEGMTAGELRSLVSERGLVVELYMELPPEGTEGYQPGEMALLAEEEVADDRVVLDAVEVAPGRLHVEVAP